MDDLLLIREWQAEQSQPKKQEQVEINDAPPGFEMETVTEVLEA